MKNNIIDFFKKVFSNTFTAKIKNFFINHKIWSAIIIIGLFFGVFFTYSKIYTSESVTQYTFGKVTRGNLIVSVDGSGQVSTLSKVSIKPNTTGQTQTLGQIISVKVKNGDTVKAGQVVAILDGKNALQTLNQAKSSLISAQANYDKVISGLTESELTSLNNSIKSATTSLNNSKQNILLSIKTAYTSISNLFYLNTDSYFSNPTGTNPRLSINGVSFSNQQLESSVNQGRYEIGFILNEWRDKVKEQSKLDASKVSDEYIIESINDVLGDLNTIRNYFDDMATLFALYNIEISDTGDINSAKSSASSARSSVDSSISSFTSSLQSYNNSITSLDQALENLRLKQEPADEATIATAKSSLENAKSNLTNAETTYASRIITAPFDGQIGGLNAEVGQQVSSSDSLGTLITSEKVINVTLNEVDAAKVSANNPVTITFDSLPGVTVSGYVAYIDPLGTVSQGVVSYSLQIKMNEQNEQVKTGMTATVSIITNQSLNTLTIPTSAITTMGTKKFVLVSNSSISTSTNQNSEFKQINNEFSSTTRGTSARQFNGNTQNTTSQNSEVKMVEITTGLSNDTTTEVLSGLSENQLIITKKTTTTTTTSTKSSASEATTNTRGGFGGGFGGGSVMMR